MRPSNSSSFLVGDHHCGELPAGVRRRRHVDELALEALLEFLRAAFGEFQVAGERRVVEADVEIVEIPFRQLAEVGFGGCRGAEGETSACEGIAAGAPGDGRLRVGS